MMQARLNPITGRVNVHLENGLGYMSEDVTPTEARKQARRLLFLANEAERIERSHEEPDEIPCQHHACGCSEEQISLDMESRG